MVLFLLITSLRALAGFYTDYLWFDNARAVARCGAACSGPSWRSGAIFTVLFFALLLRQPRSSPTASRPRSGPPAPRTTAVERYHDFVGRPGRARPRRRVAAVRPHRRRGRLGRVEPVAPVHPPQVPSASTTPRSTPTSASTSSSCPSIRLRGGVAVRGAHDHPARHGGGRTTSTAASGCSRPMQRVTPQVKAHLSVLLGVAGAGQGGRLLAGSLLAHVLDAGHGRRRHLHRRPRPAPGHPPAAVHRRCCRAACSSSTSGGGAGSCRSSPWACGRCGHRGRHHLPGVRAALPGAAGGVVEGVALHRQQHRRHPPGHGSRPRPGQARFDYTTDTGLAATGHRSRQPDHDAQHPAPRPASRAATPSAPAVRPGLLRLQRPRRRPLPDQDGQAR